jgi:TonB family protein
MPAAAICKADLSVCRESSCDGWVLLRFDVSGLGAVSNPVVTNACPAGFFDDAALKVVKEWTYPQQQAGRRGVSVRLDFRKPR